MNTWQRCWVIAVLIVSWTHLIRDILQFLELESWFTNILHKDPPANASLLWHPLNTVMIEVTLIVLTIVALKKKNFGWQGWTTIFIVIFTFIAFLMYWFLLVH